jgi:tetratricopeptide (TPR) repeat protein
MLAKLRKFVISIILLSIISTVPYLLTNLNRASSLEYFEYLLELDIQKGLPFLTVLKDYSAARGESGRYEYFRQKYDSLNPDWNKYKNALEALHRGNIELGDAILKSAKPNKFEAEYHRTSARLSSLKGDLDKALTQINSAIQLRRYFNEYYWERGMIYMKMDKPRDYLNDLRRAYELDTTVNLILDDLTFIHSYLEQYDSSIYYGEKLISRDSSRAHIYFSLGMSYVSLKNLERAEYYNKLFADLIKDDSTLAAMQMALEAEIRRLETELDKNQKSHNSGS